jgi:hypothetical protein
MDQEEAFVERVRRGVALVLFDGMSLKSAVKIVNVNFRTLQRYVDMNREISRFDVQNLELVKVGKKEYLNEDSMKALRLFGIAMDWNDYPVTNTTAIEKIRILFQKEKGLESLEDAPQPSPPTIKKILRESGLRLRSARQGVSVDALRSTKANVEYLGDWFNKLEGVRSEYKILPKNIWNADEVGIQFSDLNLKFWSSRACVRVNMANQHVTVLITSNASDFFCQPYLIFPGENTSVIPSVILENEEVWSTFAVSGWMDVERFQGWMLKFISDVKKRKSEEEKDDYVLLIVDGHNSRLNSDTMFTAAINRVIVLVGPSQLTNAWQPNDAGINKSFKENLKRLVAKHVEAKQQLSNSDIGIMISNALKMKNMKASIVNSYRHVGIEPFDRLQMARMINDEKPDSESLNDPTVRLAVQLCQDHLNTLDNLVGEKRKRDEKEKEKRKRKMVGVSTSFATILTNAENLASIQLGLQYTALIKLNANELHAEMIRMGWTLSEIRQPGKNKFHTMKTLHMMILEKLEGLHVNQQKKIDEEIKNKLGITPALSFDVVDQVFPLVQPETTREESTARPE